MSQGNKSGEPDAREASVMLDTLLERLDCVLEETKGTAGGLPLFAVEEELVGRLRSVLPGVRFTAHDIRAWAAEISS